MLHGRARVAVGVLLVLAGGGMGGLNVQAAAPTFHVTASSTITNPGNSQAYLIAGTSSPVSVTLDLSQPAGQQVWGTEFRIDVGALPITLSATGAPPYTGDAFAGFNLLAGFNTVRVGQLSDRTTDIITNGFNYGPLSGTGLVLGQYTATVNAPMVGAAALTFDNNAVYVGSGTAASTVVNPVLGVVARGDADFSGTLTQADLNILAGHFGTLTGGTWSTGDFNGDGKVNLADLAAFTQSYQAFGGVGPLSAPTPSGEVLVVVPEPGTALVLGLGAALLLARRPRIGPRIGPRSGGGR